MFDSTQILLIGVVVALTLLLSVIGVQVFFILREVRKSIQKVNKMLDDAGIVSESIAKPIASLSDSITGLASIGGLLGWFQKKRNEKRKKDK